MSWKEKLKRKKDEFGYALYVMSEDEPCKLVLLVMALGFLATFPLILAINQLSK